jgi:hypothetical protein
LESRSSKSSSAKAKVSSTKKSYIRKEKDTQQHDIQKLDSKLDSAALALIRMQQSFLDVSATGVEDPNTRANRDEAFLKEALEAARHTQSRGKDPDMAGYIPYKDEYPYSVGPPELRQNQDAGFAVSASTIINSIAQSAERRTLVGKSARKPLVRPSNLVTATRDAIQEGTSSLIEATGTNFLIDYAPVAPPPSNKEAMNNMNGETAGVLLDKAMKKSEKECKLRGILRGESYFKGKEPRPSATSPAGAVSPYKRLVEQNQELGLASRPLSSTGSRSNSRPGTGNNPQQRANETITSVSLESTESALFQYNNSFESEQK